MPPDITTEWRVERVSGLLWPGFTKRFAPTTPGGRWAGVTSWLRAPIGRVDVIPGNELGFASDTVCLRYRRWPIVDVLQQHPGTSAASVIPAEGRIRLGRLRSVRFCRFRLTRFRSANEA